MKTYVFIFLCPVVFSDFAITSEFSTILANKFVRKFLTTRFVNNNVQMSMCSKDPEEEMTTTEVIRNSGYPAEEHFVKTEDGYILGLHRIPGDPGSPAVLLHHGLFDSSFCWVVLGRRRALAYALADRGYDVWLANARGNTYSRNHTTLSPSDPEFWNFSFHEIGIYDLPAYIDYIRSIKNDGKKIMYIGHSMGTTAFFVMSSQRPDMESKLAVMFGLAPAAYVDHATGIVRFIEPYLRNIQQELSLDGKDEVLSYNVILRMFAKCFCNHPLYGEMCQDFIFSIVGFDFKRLDMSLLPLILTHTPAGASLKTFFHFGFGVSSKKFRQYDYGPQKNLKFYNRTTPPDYELRKIRVPVALFWGENDFLSQPVDVRRLYNELPNKIDFYRVNDPDFNHLDFIWGSDAPKLFYPKLFYWMEKYRNNL